MSLSSSSMSCCSLMPVTRKRVGDSRGTQLDTPREENYVSVCQPKQQPRSSRRPRAGKPGQASSFGPTGSAFCLSQFRLEAVGSRGCVSVVDAW